MIERFLIIQTAFIGDALLTLPLIQKLKEVSPASQIDVLAIPSTNEIFNSSPFVNEVIVYDKRGKQSSLLSLFKLAALIREKKYMKIYSPHRSFRSALLVMLSGVRETYGFSNSSLKHAYKHLIKYNPNDHEVKRNLSLIGNDSDENWKLVPLISEAESSKNKLKEFLNEFPPDLRFAAIAPGTVWETKRYPSEHYKEIIDFLLTKVDRVFLIGSESEEKLCTELSAGYNERVISIAGRFTVTETIELLRKAEILITNDSAPTHMAMSADIPALTIYCSTVPNFGFYPYNDKSDFISFDQLSCKPCGIHGFDECPIKTFDCGYLLKPEDINKKIGEMIHQPKV